MFGFPFGNRYGMRMGPSYTEVSDRIEIAVDEVADRVDALQLSCAAMWELLGEKLGVTDDQLIAKMQEIDARDGNEDGRMFSAEEVCPECKRRLLIRARDICSWCGHMLGEKPFGA
ncbi:MAG: hypothetical protein HONBIEJF_02161 [Fimbriimonadaceae bacterium]|nr:hypothetical protein [Fimbriimonadaceae bacterium]